MGVPVGQAGIFINYRRSDASGFAGRVEDALTREFGQARVFRDIAILPGQNWIVEIERAIGKSGAFLVLIGPHWLDRDAQGNRRLDDPTDTLRREIEAALGREMIVVPVLVGGADMPVKEDLPPALQPLLSLNGAYLTDQGWPDDVNRLIRVLGQIVGPGLDHPPPPPPPIVKILVAFVVLAIFVGAAFLIIRSVTGGGGGPTFPTSFPSGIPNGGANPKITVSPDSGPPGTTVTVTGSGFPGGGDVDITFFATRVGETTADENGSFSTTFTVPDTPFTGPMDVTANSRAFFDSATFTVTG